MKKQKQVVIISGATKGIGRETAILLSKNGYVVYGLARNLPNEQLPYKFLTCDVSKREEVETCFKQVVEAEGRLDAVINNAGMGISGAVEFTDDKKIDTIIAVNIRGVINCTRAAIPYLRKTAGKIINLSSVAAVLEIPFQAYYSATKAFVESYSRALRIELKPLNVSVSTVLPGDTKTSFTQNREKVETAGGYDDRIIRSVARMEKDEQQGMSPICVAKVILKVLKRKNPPVSITVGFQYKLIVFAKRLLPNRLINYVLYKMYGN